MASHDSHQLQVYFARREQPFIFTQPEPAHHFPASKVTIDGDVGTSPWKYAPLIRVYDEAHCIYHGVMKIPGEEDSAPERSVEVALKWVAGPIRIAYLREEADFYETNRGALQDIAPQYYGYFTAEVEGAKVACIVLEYCNGQPTHTVFEMNRQRMLAVTKLHGAGFVHGDLQNARHFVAKQDGTLRIVDFLTAGAHSCLGAHPLILNLTGDARPPHSCRELDDVEKWYGVNAETSGKKLLSVNKIAHSRAYA